MARGSFFGGVWEVEGEELWGSEEGVEIQSSEWGEDGRRFGLEGRCGLRDSHFF